MKGFFIVVCFWGGGGGTFLSTFNYFYV